MSGEILPPCLSAPTSCHTIYQSEGGTLPCLLIKIGLCRPVNNYTQNLRESTIPELSESGLIQDAHYACPISTVLIKAQNEDEEVLNDHFNMLYKRHVQKRNGSR